MNGGLPFLELSQFGCSVPSSLFSSSYDNRASLDRLPWLQDLQHRRLSTVEA